MALFHLEQPYVQSSVWGGRYEFKLLKYLATKLLRLVGRGWSGVR